MYIQFADLVTIVIMVQLLAFMAYLFTTKRGKKQSQILLGVFMLAQFLGLLDLALLGSFVDFSVQYPVLHTLLFPFTFIWGPAIFLYVLSITDTSYIIRFKSAWHATPGVLVFWILILSGIEKGEVTGFDLQSMAGFTSMQGYHIVLFVRHVQILIYILLSLRMLKKYHTQIRNQFSSLSKVHLQWLQYLLLGYCVVWIFDLSALVLNIIFEYQYPILYSIDITCFLIFFNLLFFNTMHHPEVILQDMSKQKYYRSILKDEQIVEYRKRLDSLFELQKPYLEPDLTLQDLAKQINISPRYLSQVINVSFQQSFYDLINRYRIQAFQDRIVEVVSKEKTILELMYDVGFNTKSSFNNVFKKQTHLTPSQFIKQYQISQHNRPHP